MINNPNNAKKIENALNDWLEKVEEQINVIDEKLYDKVSI